MKALFLSPEEIEGLQAILKLHAVEDYASTLALDLNPLKQALLNLGEAFDEFPEEVVSQEHGGKALFDKYPATLRGVWNISVGTTHYGLFGEESLVWEHFDTIVGTWEDVKNTIRPKMVDEHLFSVERIA